MSLIQPIVDQLVTWGTSMELTFNPTKTVCIQFTRATEKTRKVPGNKLRINGTDIPLSTETRYLGVQLDSKLTWNRHFDITVTKAKRYLCQLVGALSKYWGPQPRLAKWIYTAIVKPRVTYASLVWAHSIPTCSHTIYSSSAQSFRLQPNLHHGHLYMLYDLNSGKSQLNNKDSRHVSLYGHEH